MNEEKIKINPLKIYLPIALGLAVTLVLFYYALKDVKFQQVEKGKGNFVWIDYNNNKQIDFTNEKDFVTADQGDFIKITTRDTLKNINWNSNILLFITLAILMMIVRDLGYIIRIRLLTDKQLSWRQSFRVIMLWEFASALTPGVVGGAAIAMFILNKEGVKIGRATALVLITALMDELFYVIIVPAVIIFAGTDTFFPQAFSQEFLGMKFNAQGIFWIGFAIICLITVLLFTAIFIFPLGFKKIMLWICKLPFLKRYTAQAEKTGNDIITTSNELKGKNILYWLKVFGATAFSWTGRFLVINFIIQAFAPVANQLMVFARQLTMWVIMLVSPTPGGSGIAEIAFSGFLADLLPFGLAAILAVMWRLISYYPYLFIGSFLLPQWITKKST
jgi:uncharacterized protein (TIRG00374 family)